MMARNICETFSLALYTISFAFFIYITSTDAIRFPHQNFGDEKEAAVTVHPVKASLTRSKRSDEIFPDELEIELSTADVQQSFHHLRRNLDLSDKKPVYLMRNGEVKKYRFDNLQNVAYYSDMDSAATFMVWPKSGQNGTNVDYDIYGSFSSDTNKQYFVQPPKDRYSSHTVSKMLDVYPGGTDYIPAPKGADSRRETKESLNKSTESNTTLHREKRQTTAYEIEILFVMDYEMYNIWYSYTEGQTDRHTATVEYLYQLAAFLLNAINLRYQSVTGNGYTITCLYAGIYIADTSTAAPFVEDNVLSFGGIVASTVLNDFRDWGEASLGGNYDHAMLYSGHEIGSVNGGLFDTVTEGLAYLPSYWQDTNTIAEPGVCGSYRYSINEGGVFEPLMATVGSHELGHNLGASHDEALVNACNENDGYVMAPSAGVSNDPNKNLRHWIFSNCSLTYFDTYITDLLDYYTENRGENCLLNQVATNPSELDSYIDNLPGQIYSPDVQCELAHGTGSFLYRNFYDGNYSKICSAMACSDTSNSGSFYYYLAWEGTTCGNGKICQAGQCITSDVAPAVSNEACAFGDSPYNVPTKSETCQQLINGTSSYYCNQDFYSEACCNTCEEMRLSLSSNPEYAECGYFDTYSNCDTLTDDLYQCRFEGTQTDCCKSCLDKKLDIPDCPWGDLYSNCASAPLPCDTYSVECCQTCAPPTTSTTTTTPTTTTTTPTTTTSTPTTTTTTPTTTTTTPTTTTTTPTTTTTTPTTTTTTPTTTATTPITTTTTTPTTTTTTPTTTTTTPTTTTTTPTTTTTTPTTTTTTPTTTATTPTTTTTTTPTTTTTTPTTTTTTPTTTTTTPTTTTTTPTTTTTTTPTTTTTTPTTTTTTPTTTTTTPTTTTTTPTTTTTTPTTTTTTPTTTTTTTPTTTTTTPTTTTTTPTTTTTTPTTTTTTTPTTTTTTPTTTTTTPTTTTTTTPTTTTTTPTTTTTTPTTTTITPTTTTTTPSTTTTTPTTTTTTTPTTTTTTPTTTTTTPTTTTTTPTTTTTTPTTTTSTTTTTTTPTTTTTTPTTTTTTPTTTTTTPTTTTTTPITTTTTPTTMTTTLTTTKTTPTTTTTTPTTTTTTPTTTTTTPTTTTTTPTTTMITPTTTTTTPTITSTTPTTTTTTPTTTTTTPTTTTTTPTTTTTTPTTTTTSPTITTTTPTTATTTVSAPTTTSTTASSTTMTMSSTTTTSTSTTTTAPNVRISVFILVFPINVVTIDLNTGSVRLEISIIILTYYKGFVGLRIRRLNIRSLRRGSLIVEYDIEYEDDAETASELTKANTDLVSGKEKITLLNETVSATSIQINNTIVTNETVNNPDTVCELFIRSSGPCGDGYFCAVQEGSPVCVPEKTDDGLVVVVAVSASILVFLVAVLLIILFSIRAYRLRKLKHSPESSSTGASDPEEQDWPHKQRIAPYGSLGGRQDRPMAYLPYQGEVIREHGHRKQDSRYSQSMESHGHYSSHRASHRSDRDRDNRFGNKGKHNRSQLHNYGYDNRAMEYDQILAASYISNTGYERR